MSLKHQKAQGRKEKGEGTNVASSSKVGGGGGGGGREPLVEFRGKDHAGKDRWWERVLEAWTLVTLKELVRKKISLPDGYGLDLYRWVPAKDHKLLLEEEADVNALHTQINIAFSSAEEVVILFIVVVPPPAAPSAPSSSSTNHKSDENKGSSPPPPVEQAQARLFPPVEEDPVLGGEEEREEERRSSNSPSAADEPQPSAAASPPPPFSAYLSFSASNAIDDPDPAFDQADPRTNLGTFSSTESNPNPSPPRTSHQRSSLPEASPPPTHPTEPVDPTSESSRKRKERSHSSSSDPSTSATLVDPPQPSKRSKTSSSASSFSSSEQDQAQQMFTVPSDGLEDQEPSHQLSSNGWDASREMSSRTGSNKVDDGDAGRASGSEGEEVEEAEAWVSSRRRSVEVEEEGYERQWEESEAVGEIRSDGGSNEDEDEAQQPPAQQSTSRTNVANSLLHLAINSDQFSAQHLSSSSASNEHQSPPPNPDASSHPGSSSPNHHAHQSPLAPPSVPTSSNHASPSSRKHSHLSSSAPPQHSIPSQRARLPNPFTRASLPPPPSQTVNLATTSHFSHPPHSPSSSSSSHLQLASTSPSNSIKPPTSSAHSTTSVPLWQSTAPLCEPEELDDSDDEELEMLRSAREAREADANRGHKEGEVGLDAAESRDAGGTEPESEGLGGRFEQVDGEEGWGAVEEEVERVREEEMGSKGEEEVGFDAIEVDASFGEASEAVEQTNGDQLDAGDEELERTGSGSQPGDEAGREGTRKHQRAKKRKRKNSIVDRAPSSSSNTTTTNNHPNKKIRNIPPSNRPPPPPARSLQPGGRRRTLIDLNAPGPSTHSPSQRYLPPPNPTLSSSDQHAQPPFSTMNTTAESHQQQLPSSSTIQDASPSSSSRKVVVADAEGAVEPVAGPSNGDYH